VYNSSGELFFTDPPYGLKDKDDDIEKEIPINGVYKLNANNEVVLLVDSLSRPNGIAFLPGEKTLLVANSDPDKPNWYAFDLADDGSLQNARIFYSAKDAVDKAKGLPDGFKVDRQGNVFATGPGGIWIFNRNGKLLGKLLLPEATSNCSLSGDEKTLYITNHMQVLKFKMRD
jgi:gluconolactonase